MKPIRLKSRIYQKEFINVIFFQNLKREVRSTLDSLISGNKMKEIKDNNISTGTENLNGSNVSFEKRNSFKKIGLGLRIRCFHFLKSTGSN